MTPLPGACDVLAAGPPRGDAALPTSPSPLESAFSARAGEPLRQFGYDLFAPVGEPVQAEGVAPGAIQGDYVLNTGDALLVTLRGQKSFSKRFSVDRNGQLVVDDLRPVTAAGLTLDALRQELTTTVAATWPNTDAFATLAEVRRIGVMVTGAVRRPGRQEISAFATVLDALSAAGGVERGGTLRAIRLIRAGAGMTVDLYPLQTAGRMDGNAGNADQPLRDGDRLFVPPLGATVAVAGPVKRPGIYELPPGAGPLSAMELRDLAGGALRPGRARLLRFGIGPVRRGGGRGGCRRSRCRTLRRRTTCWCWPRSARIAATSCGWRGMSCAPARAPCPRRRPWPGWLPAPTCGPIPICPSPPWRAPTPATAARILRPVDLAAVLAGRDLPPAGRWRHAVCAGGRRRRFPDSRAGAGLAARRTPAARPTPAPDWCRWPASWRRSPTARSPPARRPTPPPD